ncbi:MAG: superoxide dismutase family protein [Deltaproteobacteria bacterium]|nr:superoxide dismutase family protein [Deltaproteobacteria bacterium]
MKIFALGAGALLVAACSHDGRDTTITTTTSRTQPATNEPLRDLDVAPKVLDNQPITEVIDPGSQAKQPVREAIAVLQPSAGSDVEGVVRFVDRPGHGLEVSADVRRLSPGRHGFHVHLYGDCSSPDANSAGPHFHFFGASLDPNVPFITGELGELVAGDEGHAVARGVRLRDAALQGPFSIIGRAVVVHAHGDDPAHPPSGDAGERIACGVIGVANPQANVAAH